MINITLQTLENCDLVIIKGRIDSYTAPDLSEMLNQRIIEDHYKILLDLGDVSFISSAGLRVFIDIQKKCKKDQQGELILVHVPQRVYETIELAGFAPLFKFFDNVTSAIEAF